MDEEGWYSVTPEQIAIRHARRCVAAASNSNPLVIDCFAGVGGNAIQFARMCCSVVAIDIDPHKLELAIHNAKIYGVQHCIDFIIGDFFQLAPLLKVMLIIEIRLNVVWFAGFRVCIFVWRKFSQMVL